MKQFLGKTLFFSEKAPIFGQKQEPSSTQAAQARPGVQEQGFLFIVKPAVDFDYF